jgi:hypothetical protein
MARELYGWQKILTAMKSQIGVLHVARIILEAEAVTVGNAVILSKLHGKETVHEQL